jgi:hypothetical protein
LAPFAITLCKSTQRPSLGLFFVLIVLDLDQIIVEIEHTLTLQNSKQAIRLLAAHALAQTLDRLSLKLLGVALQAELFRRTNQCRTALDYKTS